MDAEKSPPWEKKGAAFLSLLWSADGGTGPVSLNPWDIGSVRMLDRIWDGELSSRLCFSSPRHPLILFPPGFQCGLSSETSM